MCVCVRLFVCVCVKASNLQLDNVMDSFIGDNTVRGISGGQKRRVTMGMRVWGWVGVDVCVCARVCVCGCGWVGSWVPVCVFSESYL